MINSPPLDPSTRIAKHVSPVDQEALWLGLDEAIRDPSLFVFTFSTVEAKSQMVVTTEM